MYLSVKTHGWFSHPGKHRKPTLSLFIGAEHCLTLPNIAKHYWTLLNSIESQPCQDIHRNCHPASQKYFNPTVEILNKGKVGNGGYSFIYIICELYGQFQGSPHSNQLGTGKVWQVLQGLWFSFYFSVKVRCEQQIWLIDYTSQSLGTVWPFLSSCGPPFSVFCFFLTIYKTSNTFSAF